MSNLEFCKSGSYETLGEISNLTMGLKLRVKYLRGIFGSYTKLNQIDKECLKNQLSYIGTAYARTLGYKPHSNKKYNEVRGL